MAKKTVKENYQHKLRCPKCNKRKVYVIADDEGSRYSCKACGHSWRA